MREGLGFSLGSRLEKRRERERKKKVSLSISSREDQVVRRYSGILFGIQNGAWRETEVTEGKDKGGKLQAIWLIRLLGSNPTWSDATPEDNDAAETRDEDEVEVESRGGEDENEDAEKQRVGDFGTRRKPNYHAERGTFS